jgi:hypothetical protein
MSYEKWDELLSKTRVEIDLYRKGSAVNEEILHWRSKPTA